MFKRSDQGFFRCLASATLTPMSLKRYMHQSVVVKINNKSHLLTMGGKYDPLYWSNGVASLDLSLYLNPKLVEDVPEYKENRKLGIYDLTKWNDCKPMKEARSNFAATVIDNLVYVYGGISGRKNGSGEGKHYPQMVSKAIE